MVYLIKWDEELEIESIYTYEKITSLYKNFDILSFIDLLTIIEVY